MGSSEALVSADLPEFWVGPPAAPDTFGLISMLGGGGEGEVWEAVLPLSAKGRRTVAVKIVAAAGCQGEVRDWERSGHLLRSLAHPGLVRITDVFAGAGMHRVGDAGTGEFLYSVMDYVEGVSLREWVVEHPETPASERLRMLRMVAAALDSMHSGATTGIPVAHGDVKPANIVVRADRATVLVDLGLARLTDGAGISGLSAPYAAPELRTNGALATPEADRYAFAVTTAQVLTGAPPPLQTDGWLDEAALEAMLHNSPTTAGRAMLTRQILDMITAAPADRVGELRPWLDGAVESLSRLSMPLTTHRAGVHLVQTTTPTVPQLGPEAPTALRAGSSPSASTRQVDRARTPRSRRQLIILASAVALALVVGVASILLLPRGDARAAATNPVGPAGSTVTAFIPGLPSVTVAVPTAPLLPNVTGGAVPVIANTVKGGAVLAPAAPGQAVQTQGPTQPDQSVTSDPAPRPSPIGPAGRILDLEIMDDPTARAKTLSWGPPKDDQLGGGVLVAYEVAGKSPNGNFSDRVTSPDYLDRRNYCGSATYTITVITTPPGGGGEVRGVPYVSTGSADGACVRAPQITSVTPTGPTTATVTLECGAAGEIPSAIGPVVVAVDHNDTWTGTCSSGSAPTATLTDLQPGTTYQIQAGRINGDSTVYGDPVGLATPTA